MKQQVRYDVGRMDAAKIDDKGYLKATAFATRVGVFTYLMRDGTVRRELRPPEEVFKKQSMESLKEIVITNNHPPEQLNSRNTKQYAAGWTGTDVKRVDKFIQTDIKITDADLITDIMNGKDELSCGYHCVTENTSGEWEGEHYDAIQRDIFYNHLSSVDRGRAGPEVKINFDGIDDFGVMKTDASDDEKINSEKKDVQKNINAISSHNKTHFKERIMTKITIDGVEYECSESLAPVLVSKFKEADKLKSDAAQAIAEKDRLEGKVVGLESDAKIKNDKIAELEKKTMTDKQVMDRAEEITKVHSFAKKVIGEDFKADGMSLAEIKKAAVAKAKPDLNLEGKSDGYIDGLFEGISESHEDSSGDELKNALSNHAKDKSSKRYDKNDAYFASMQADVKHFQEYKGI